jgi:serine/threonine-protein kinase
MNTGEHSPIASYARVLELARGGMGEVELALRSDGTFRRLYAIKRLHEPLQADEEFRAMFMDEARVAGLIRHPNVVSVLDVGEDDRGPFLVMEYVEGVSVHTLLKRLNAREEVLPIQVVVRIVADTARGLHAAHQLTTPEGTPLNLVHRDVSPQNVMIDYDGTVRVMDFGVAKAFGRLTRTDSGLLKGKIGYMSPEQLRFRDIDRRSDLFSLGVVLHELLTGQRLYGSKHPTPAPRRILEESPSDPGEARSDIPPELVALVFELLAKDPELRPATARKVADRLDTVRVRLEAEEGPINLSDYLQDRFSQEREAQQKAIAAGLRRLEERGDPSIQIEVGGSQPPTASGRFDTVADTPRGRQKPRRRTTIAIVVAAIVGAVALALAPSLLPASDDSTSSDDETVTTAATPPPPEPAAAPQPERAETPSQRQEAPVEAATEPAKANSGGLGTTTPRRRRGRSREQAAAETMAPEPSAMQDMSGERPPGVSLWEWTTEQ